MVTPSVTCYPQPGKTKSRVVLEAFACGAGGAALVEAPPVLSAGGVAFFGVVGIEHLLRLSIAEGRAWYYGDNSYFDAGRGRYFRFTRGWFQQVRSEAVPAPERLEALGLRIAPWQRTGEHIVVVEQSEHFLELSGAGRHWLLRVLSELQQHTKRPIMVRRWSRNKDGAAATLADALKGAWALVTHMSAAATEAVLAGVPVFVSGRCAAEPMASGPLSSIESPRYPDGREEWAARLAASQWTLDELRAGLGWRTLHGL